MEMGADMQSNLKLTVIIPVFNAVNHIDKCLNSVFEQTFQDFEIIAVNDCSTDDSKKILDNYEHMDKRLKCLHLQRNHGVSYARNIGIDHAKGEYITFIDVDDIIDKSYFENSLNTSVNFDIIISGLKIGNDRNYVTHVPLPGEFLNPIDINRIFPALDQSPILSGPFNKFYKTNIIKERHITFPPFSLGEDQCFVLNYLKYCNSAKTISYAGYYYIKQDTPTLSKGKQRSYEEVDSFLNLKFKLKNDLLRHIGLPGEGQTEFQKKNLLTYITRTFAIYSDKSNKSPTDRRKLLLQARNDAWISFYKKARLGRKYSLLKPLVCYLPLYVADIILHQLFKHYHKLKLHQ